MKSVCINHLRTRDSRCRSCKGDDAVACVFPIKDGAASSGLHSLPTHFKRCEILCLFFFFWLRAVCL